MVNCCQNAFAVDLLVLPSCSSSMDDVVSVIFGIKYQIPYAL